MAGPSRRVERGLRLLASEGWAEADTEVVRELLAEARDLAGLVVADSAASNAVRAAAQALLERLSAASPEVP